MDEQRRRFLKFVVVGGASVGAAAVLFQLPTSLRGRVLRTLVNARMPDGPVGGLSPHARSVLASFAQTLLGDTIDVSRYLSMFELRAVNIDGHRDLIETFADRLDRESMNSFGVPYADLQGQERLRHVSSLTELRKSRAKRLLASALEPTNILVNEHVVNPLIIQFARTDAWIELGYDSFAGHARGLESYRELPRA